MNAQRNKKLFFVIVVALLLALSACQSMDPICESTIRDAGDYKNGCGMSVPGGADSAEMSMQVRLDQGSLKWTLTDPQGIVRWQGQAAAGQDVSLSRAFQNPAPGRWDLVIELEQAAGEYHAPWKVQQP